MKFSGREEDLVVKALGCHSGEQGLAAASSTDFLHDLRLTHLIFLCLSSPSVALATEMMQFADDADVFLSVSLNNWMFFWYVHVLNSSLRATLSAHEFCRFFST